MGGPADFGLVHGAVWSVRFVNVQLPFPFRFVLTRVSARGYPVCLQYRMSLNPNPSAFRNQGGGPFTGTLKTLQLL